MDPIDKLFDNSGRADQVSRNISPCPHRPDNSELHSAFLADRGEKTAVPATAIPPAPGNCAH